MKKITAYKLTDGTIMEDEKYAAKVQNRLDFEVKAWEFACKHGSYEDGKQQIFDAITDNAAELKKILEMV